MRLTTHLLRTATLAATIGLLPALAPASAEAQGKGHKSGQHKEKGEKVKHNDRDGARDDRYSVRSSDRDVYYETGQPARSTRVPPGQRPPAGMCRIWVDGVPPGRQPRPTDCATAERNVPPNARVIYGDGSSRDGIYDRRDRTGDRRTDRRTDRRSDRRTDGRTDAGTIYGGRTTTGSIPGGNWPYMSDALAFSRGTRTSTVASLVPGATSVQLSSQGGNSLPREAMFYGSGGQLLSVWRDLNGDGRADRVTEYQYGQVVGDYSR
jgi:hypothetical protein